MRTFSTCVEQVSFFCFENMLFLYPNLFIKEKERKRYVIRLYLKA